MSDNHRKLLPYEHQLVEALGITKEEYVDFVAQQHTYDDAKEGSILDIRQDLSVIAIVLVVIGTLMQVVAALLPKPEEKRQGQAATRDEVFAPRFGFNSSQELAAYGDPIHLVYTNQSVNPDGGVHVATSLVWSAVQSYGNSQLVQLLFVIGAGGISAIDEKLSAFGQTALRDLIAQNYWFYFSPNYTGALRNSFLRPDPYGQSKVADPTRHGSDKDNPYRIRTQTSGAKSDGFSHAYSPSSSAAFGVYGVIPVNIEYNIRNEAGSFVTSGNGITMTGWSGSYTKITKDQLFTVTLKKIVQNTNIADKEADETRQTLATVFDNSGVFKFGATKLKLVSANRPDVVDGDMIVKLQALENGQGSIVPYASTDRDNIKTGDLLGLTNEFNVVKRIAEDLLRQDQRVIKSTGIGSKVKREIIIPTAAESRRLKELTATELADDGSLFTSQVIAQSSSKTAKTFNPANSKRARYEIAYLRDLTDSEKIALYRYDELKTLIDSSNSQDDVFYLKSICRIEEAAYETMSPCNIVDFSIKARVFKRVSGRQDTYGSRQAKGWSSADNGIKMRTSMFLVKFKKTEDDGGYSYLPGIFVVRRAADIDNFIYLRFNANGLDAAHWQFKFEPVFDPAAEFASKSELTDSATKKKFYYYLENSGNPVVNNLSGKYKGISFEYSGMRKEAKGIFPPLNITPGGMNEWDMFTNTSDEQVQFSFDNGPEFSLATVTEQIVTPFSNFPGLYNDLALAGLNMYSGKSVQDLRSFTIFVTQGRRSRLLNHSLPLGRPQSDYLSSTPNGSANTAPDIFIDTILDANDGIGKYATIDSTDLEQLAASKRFCLEYKLFMDGIIAEPVSWRSFWTENSGFSLLELAKVGGRDVLVPALPCNKATGEVNGVVSISALFNQGNILEESYKEEYIDYGSNTQDAIVTAIYRTTDDNSAFSRNTSVDVSLTGITEDNAVRETIDMSRFVTRREQAVMVAKLICQTKRHSRRAIEFKTLPTDSPVYPGGYIYVELAQNQWDNIYTGVVENGGYLNTPLAPSIPNGQYSVLCYANATTDKQQNVNNVNSGTKHFTNVQVTNGVATALSGSKGQLFVLGKSVKNRRVFRVVEVAMDEEGEVTVKAVEHATDTNGNSLIARGIVSLVSGLFSIDGKNETVLNNR